MIKYYTVEEINCSLILVFTYMHLVMLAANVVIFVCVNVMVANVIIKVKMRKCVHLANLPT